MIKGIVNGVEKDIVRIPMKGKNLFDLSTATNEFINSNGSITPSSAGDPYYLSDYISADNVTISVQYKETAVAEIFTVGVYDSDKRFIRRDVISNNSASYENVAYIRINYRDKNCQNVMLNAGSTQLPYEPYGMQQGWEVRKGDGTLIWGRNDTISVDSGTLPVKGYGVPLKSVEVEGNMTQTGTPDPTTPIWPDETGERTGNLFDTATVEKGRIDNGVVGYASNTTNLTVTGNTVEFTTNYNYRGVCSGFIEIPDGATDISFSGRFTGGSGIGKKIVFYNSQKTWMDSDVSVAIDVASRTTSIPSGAKYVRLSFTAQTSGTASISNLMLNTGSTALPYEPFGYKVALTANSTTTPIYLGQTQTTRQVKKLVLTGEELGVNKRTSPENSYSISLERNGWSSPTTGYGISSHFARNGNIAALIDGEFYVGSSAFSFRLDDCADVTAFKSYLAAQNAAGTPVTVWYVLSEPATGVVNEPIRKIGTYADTLTVTDQDVTITPAVGNDTITVDTTLPPSKLTVVGHIRERST